MIATDLALAFVDALADISERDQHWTWSDIKYLMQYVTIRDPKLVAAWLKMDEQGPLPAWPLLWQSLTDLDDAEIIDIAGNPHRDRQTTRYALGHIGLRLS